jgi:uncharacterized protein YdaU (DUF1376 family)
MMPLWVNDLDGDTEHLSCAQLGAYMRLLMSMWRHGGWIVNDDRVLARICRCDEAEWPALRPFLMPFLMVNDDSTMLSQKRLLKVRVDSTNYRTWQSENGKRGAEARARARAGSNPPAPAPARGNEPAHAQASTRAPAGTDPASARAGRINESYPYQDSPQTPHEGPSPREDLGYQTAAQGGRGARVGGPRTRPDQPPDSAPRRRTSDWDDPNAGQGPKPIGETDFMRRFRAFQEGDKTALEPRPGAPLQPAAQAAREGNSSLWDRVNASMRPSQPPPGTTGPEAQLQPGDERDSS